MSEAERQELKRLACESIDQMASDLIAASHSIHEHPELNYEETHAHQVLTDVISAHGVAVTRGAYDLSTAFDVGVGELDAPCVAVLCEYDALPQIGHACGHNVIAGAGLGAGLALAKLAARAGGRVRLMGTPAEEGGGGKIKMANRGAFDGVDAAMMVHPADADLIRMDAIAIESLIVKYSGRAAHAAAAPHLGLNALDAAVLGYQGVAALRQHILPNERIHGIFIKGGDKANIVPQDSEMSWYVRSPTMAGLEPLKRRVVACLEAGASATGCSCEIEWDGQPYSDMHHNGPLVASYVSNAAHLGRSVKDPVTLGKNVVGSTDMGNVSYIVPSIHPTIQVAPEGVAIHTKDFAEWARSPEGDRAVLDGAKSMAMTAIDFWTDADLRAATKAAFALIRIPSPRSSSIPVGRERAP